MLLTSSGKGPSPFSDICGYSPLLLEWAPPPGSCVWTLGPSEQHCLRRWSTEQKRVREVAEGLYKLCLFCCEPKLSSSWPARIRKATASSPTSGHTVPTRRHCGLKLGAKMNFLSLPAPLLTSMKANKTFSNMTLPSVTHTGSWQWRIRLCLMLKGLPETCFCNLLFWFLFFSLNIALIRAQQQVSQRSSSENTAPIIFSYLLASNYLASLQVDDRHLDYFCAFNSCWRENTWIHLLFHIH